MLKKIKRMKKQKKPPPKSTKGQNSSLDEAGKWPSELKKPMVSGRFGMQE